MSERAYNMKSALPNKVLDEDGNTTDLFGNPIVATSEAYKNKPSLPNKWLNPDGTYSTLTEIIAGAIDTDVFVIVDELPEEGNPKKIYLVPDGKGGFIEYHYVDGKWDPIGTVEIDLSQYSTTDEMNAAILAALNSAKAYTDEQIAGISVDPQVFYWDGDTQQAGIAFWQNVVEVNKKSDVIVNGYNTLGTVNRNVFSIIQKGRLYNELVKHGQVTTLFSYQMNRVHQNSYSVIRDNAAQVKLEDSAKEGIVKGMTYTASAYTYSNATYLSIDQDYSTPYTPQYPGSPATKKYVDDAISNNITSALGGEY